VAHEINNPLQTIVGAVELMLEEQPTPEMRRDLEMVRREGTRAGQIVRNLLSFVRRSAPDRVAADLNDLVRATAQLREYHLSQHNITLVTELQNGRMPVLVNREEIQQVALNLILNAEQAMLTAGRGSRITIRSHTSGRNQIVEVEDDGPGVSAELHRRIFEPFFTTKEVGQGTGLGLSISHGIASAHGGSLDLCAGTSGACFRLTLPACAEAGARAAAAAVDGEPLRRALVVDDEKSLRQLLARLLKRRGFEVFEAETGSDALLVARGVRLALVLCDVRMPGMSGTDLYRELTSRDPELRRSFIFITGDRSSVVTEDWLAHVPVLVKPFSSEDLDAALAGSGIDTPVA
jgi:two-component system NtrC family sensor kinase